MKYRAKIFLFLVLLSGWGVVQGEAQVLRLLERGSSSNRISVNVGQVVTIQVIADLTGYKAAGISFFISVPADAFIVRDTNAEAVGVQPFVVGPLFSGGGQIANILLPETDSAAQNLPGQQLEYSAVVGGGGNRERTGSGVVATFSLECILPIVNGVISIDDSPIRETRLVLADGISEQRFRTVNGMEISVTGIEMRDIPDVILLPGQVDSLTIGNLNAYVVRASVPIDSLRWSFSPTNFDSLEIEIDPRTRRVKITPVPGWIGRRQVTWTVTEPEARIPGYPPVSRSDVSTIIVNTPPVFTLDPDASGVKRDTIRFREDQYPFRVGESNPDPSRAFQWRDLDDIVFDPEIVDPQTELSFAPLVYGAFGPDNNLRGQVNQNHQLLVWSKADFFGRDSLKVVVRDGLRGGEDSLRVIVEVEGVNDGPRFTIQDKSPKVSRGGSKTYQLADIVADPDTPLGDLLFSWEDDPGGHFKVDTVRVDATVAITVKGTPDYSGDGRVKFIVKDPADPVALVDVVILLFEASEVLPPSVFPHEIKVDLSPGGDALLESLRDFVEDPDNADNELAWILPPEAYKSLIGIDENRILSVSAPLEYTGYEEVILTVTDPDNQSDFLKLRIYSSDEDPVAGGIPDLIMDRGETNQEIDLDSYYYDSDNLDEEVLWEALKTYTPGNLQVTVDQFTHVATFFVPETAAFKTETVVFRVIDPAGTAAVDTMRVAIRSGGDPGIPDFRIKELPTDLQVPVGTFADVLDLDDYVAPAGTPVNWTVALVAGDHSVPRVIEGDTLSILGLTAGIDTLQVTAQDTLGRVKTATTTVRVVGENELLKLLSIPDIQLLAGQSVYSDTLSIYVEDRQTHPDSVVQWSMEFAGPAGNIYANISADKTLFATARDTGSAQIVLIARNPRIGVTGRDTIRVIALDASLGNTALKAFPPVVFVTGQGDSSIVLNEFLPDELIPADGIVPKVNWKVSGQRITQPIIDPKAPHLLRLKGVGNQIGRDTLSFVANIGGGFRAVGPMEVTVMEQVDDTTLELQVVPNPVNARYLSLYVVARRELAGTPNVFRTFEASDSTVQVRQLEGDLVGRKAMVWSGSVRLPANASGTIFFLAQASTVLGTDVKDTVSVTIGTTAAGKPLVLGHGDVRLSLPVDALPAETSVLMQGGRTQRTQLPPAGENGRMGEWEMGGEGERERGRKGVEEWRSEEEGTWREGEVEGGDGAVDVVGSFPNSAEISGEMAGGELELLSVIDIYPAGQALGGAGNLRVDGAMSGQDGIYGRRAQGWEYIGPADRPAEIWMLGRFGVLRDGVPPRVELLSTPEAGRLELAVGVADAGSGVDENNIRLWLDGEEVFGEYAEGILRWSAPVQLAAGSHLLELRVGDRARNQAQTSLTFQASGPVLPQTTELGRSFPNPFNPETTIPFTLALLPGDIAGGTEVRLAIYNISGQLVRRLLEKKMAPGRYQVQWDGRDAGGQQVGSGVYLYRLETSGAVWTRRMTLLK